MNHIRKSVRGRGYSFLVFLGLTGILAIFIFPPNITQAVGNQLVKAEMVGERGFRMTTGEYGVEFGEDTDGAIQIYHSRTRGVIGLYPLGIKGRLNLLRSVNEITLEEENNILALVLKGETSWTGFNLTLSAYKDQPGLIRWVLRLTPKRIPRRLKPDREIHLFYRRYDRVLPVSDSRLVMDVFPTSVFAKQLPFAAPLIYLSNPGLLGGTLLYFQDLTSLNDLFRSTKGGAGSIMVDFSPKGDGFGFRLPGKTLHDLPRQEEILVTDSYLYLYPHQPMDEADRARTFFTLLSAVYDLIQKPGTEPTDWQDLARKEITDFRNSEKLWVNYRGKPFLRAYVADKRTSPELISQLDVLLALTKYHRQYGGVEDLIKKITAGLPDFYKKDFGCIVNNPTDSLHGDSWYLIGEMIQLVKLAQMGNQTARDVLLRSSERVIQFAQTVNYEFPVFFSYPNFQPLEGSEPDVAGGYAYLMLELYELTGEEQYLVEAKESIQHIRGKEFYLNYELQMTALCATSCARLYQLTGDEGYLDLSFMPLANVLHCCWLWECDYGFGEDYQTFFGLSPMRYSGVITIKEQYETWVYLCEYLRLTHGKTPYGVEKMVSEFCKYTLSTMKYTLPPLLPGEAVAPRPHTWQGVDENDPSLYIPAEDLREGRSLSCQIGQEIYGAGGPITFAAAAYLKLRPQLRVYSEYPIVAQDDSTFTLAGIPGDSCWVEVYTDGIDRILNNRGRVMVLNKFDSEKTVFRANGGETYQIKFYK